MAAPLDVAEVMAAVKKHGSIKAARADFPGVSRDTFRQFCQDNQITYQTAAKPEAPPVIHPPRPVYRVSQHRPDGKDKLRLLLIGDGHDDPRIPDKSRFLQIGRCAESLGVDILLSIGDLFTIGSLCRFEPNHTLRGRAKPTFQQDMDSGEECLDALAEGLGNHRPEKHITLGNHEDRIYSFTDLNPEIAGMMDRNLHTILQDRGWGASPFGQYHYIGGVAFTHIPLNGLGKPYGGMHAENQIARDVLTDIVYGHTHKRLEKRFPKLDGKGVTVLNAGCSLPEGFIEEYAKHSLTGWTWGVTDVTIQRGRIQKAHWMPMLELEERYG